MEELRIVAAIAFIIIVIMAASIHDQIHSNN